MERLLKSDIVIEMGNLNVTVGFDYTLLKNAMGKQSLGDRNDNGERFVVLCSFHHH